MATAAGVGYNIPFPPVPVEVPYLAAGCAVEWAEQAVGGEREFRYRVSNPGTPPLTTVVLPAGRQHGVSTALVPAGWTATLGALATTFSGSLGHGQSLRLALRSAQPAGEPLLAGIGTGTQTLWAAVGVPGPSQPRPLATWTDATGFHARFLVRPGTVVRASHSSDLSDWSDPSDLFPMPITTNLLELDHPLAAPAFFLRLQRDTPPAPESPDLLTGPLEGTWTAPVPPQPETPVGTAVRMPAP